MAAWVKVPTACLKVHDSAKWMIGSVATLSLFILPAYPLNNV